MSSPVVTRRGAQKAKIQTRGMVKDQHSQKTISSSSLQEAKKRAKERLNQRKSAETILIKDIYQIAMNSATMIRGATGLIYDNRMSEHRCLWEPDYPECPERFTRVLERCTQLNLIERCQVIFSRNGTLDEILLKHTEDHYNSLKSISQCTNETELEEHSSRYDAIYFHPTTFDLSVLAVGCTIELIDNILLNKVQNGMAIIRPPGHHAMKAEFNGYCFFNNVAIAAQHALDNRNVQKILIVDWDIHHGQSSQRMFYNDPRVLYFSIHRYEHGMFWPNLRESDFDCIGEADGLGYNFNVPLNQTGMTNGDYLAIFQQILLPVAVEYQPDLVIVSAGYDAAYGCPEGEMNITPACYPHLLSPLLALADGKVAVILEGGYCLQSLSEGAALTLKGLLGDPCPLLVEDLEAPCTSMQETILNCIDSHRPYWKSLHINETYDLEELNNVNPQPNLHKVIQSYKWTEPPLKRFPTRDWFPRQSKEFLRTVEERLTTLQFATNLNVPAVRVCYVYDDCMIEHKNIYEDHPERPERIQRIEKRFREYGLLERLMKVPTRMATFDELSIVHTAEHIQAIEKTKDGIELRNVGEQFKSIYFHPKTYECAAVAAGSVLEVVDHVLNGNARSGVCVVRPPGHHAEADAPQGFCHFNNVGIAAQYAIRDHGLTRILIIDWDVHHGNGTQHIFESSSNVLYISVHRYDYGNFFPNSKDANYTVVGNGAGKGFNVNIPWNKKGMGDNEYVAVFQRIIMPIAYEFNPELVIISAGFDAAIGDPLGGCKVTPEAFGYFTHWLSSLANGKVILCLEGGYNINSISYAMTLCTKALLGDPIPKLQQTTQKLNSSCIETIQNVLTVQEKYWKSLKFNKKLPNFDDKLLKSEIEDVTATLKNITFNENAGGDNSQSGVSGSGPGTNNEPKAGPSKVSDKSKGTLVNFLRENLQALENEEMYAVYPLKTCPHLSSLDLERIQTINTKDLCTECSTETVENWLCLHCAKVCCGRFINEHMLFHYLDTEHPLTLSFADLSVWCYKCESYIDNPKLFKYKNLAHLDKFGEEMVWSYGTDTLVLE